MTPDAIFEPFYDQAMAWIDAISQMVAASPVSFAFAAGMLATMNPCGFVMLPAFAAFYTTTATPGHSLSLASRTLRACWMGVLVTVTFIAIFAFIGAVVTAGGRVVMQGAGWAGIVVGILLAAFGLVQLVSRRSLFTDMSGVRVRHARTNRGVILFGAAYAISSLGCTLPVFMVVAGTVFLGDRDFVGSFVRFIEFAAGMGVVLTAVAVGASLAREQVVRLVRPVLPLVEPAANIALIMAGLYIVWYWSSKADAL